MSTEVAKLDDGKCFGELALLHNKQRAASIITLQDTHFAVMNKQSFEKVMSEIKLREISENIDFLDKFSYIKQLTKQSKTKLTYYAEKKKYVIGQEVFLEGED
jgi:CRP-like cAMP-binding protein